jgi:cation transporter-like permease
VEQAIESIRSREDVEMVFYLYLTDEEGRLVGVVSLRQLLLTRPDTALRSIMNRRVIKVNTDADQTTVALLVDKYRLLAIPVVDQDDILVGMVTVDDVIDVIEEETTRDMLKMAGTSESETFTHSALKVAGIRLPWLLAAFIGGLAATMVIEKYESILAQVLVLSAFLPVIMGMAGNVGVQSATVAVRGLATGAIDVRDTLPLVLKELRVGLVLGGFYGVILAAYGYLMHDSLQLGQVVGLTILGNMTGAALLAVLLPMIFQRLKVDPAVATGPFVTTAIDILGVLNYFVIWRGNDRNKRAARRTVRSGGHRTGGHGRRLWRHRHQSAVHRQGSLWRSPSAGRHRSQRAGHPLAGLLGLDDHGFAEVCPVHHPCRQQGRGRHHGADRAGTAHRECVAASPLADVGSGDFRRRTVLRRCRDHAGDVGPLGGRGTRSGDAAAQALRPADHRCHPDPAVLFSAARHGGRRRAVRPGDDVLVRHPRRCSACGT